MLKRLCIGHRAFWYNSISTEMLLKDRKYSGFSPQPAYEEQTFSFQPGDSHAMQVCRLSMYTKWAEEVHTGIIMSPITDSRMTLPPAERADAYLQACLEVLEGLPEDQRRILDALDPVPWPWQFHLNVTHPWMTGRFEEGKWGWLHLLMQRPPGVEHPAGTYHQWAADRAARAEALPGLEHRRKSLQELQHLPKHFVEGFRELDVWPVRDEHIEVVDIPGALREGRTAVFDATRLCGKEIFNLTMPDIAKLHGKEASEIPIFKVNSAGYGDGTYDTLEELGHRFATWSDMGWQKYPGFGPFASLEEQREAFVASTPDDWVIRKLVRFIAWLTGEHEDSVALDQLVKWMTYRTDNSQTSINVKRLPRFPLQDMYKNLGSPSWVQRLWNLLWIGPVGDFWHFDEQDNLLICVSGNLYVAVMEQNYSDLVSGTRNVGLGFNNLEGFFKRRNSWEQHWIDSNPWIRKVPIHFMKLEPGMGITVPSRTYHNVMALDGNRILMNCFFYPKWRAAEDAPAIHNSWFRPGRQADTYMAMWYLKAQSVWRLWDTKRVGGFFAGYKLEFM